jgi:hypothetical protein
MHRSIEVGATVVHVVFQILIWPLTKGAFVTEGARYRSQRTVLLCGRWPPPGPRLDLTEVCFEPVLPQRVPGGGVAAETSNT